MSCEHARIFGISLHLLTKPDLKMDDAKLAVETGVDGVDVVIGTSSYLREHSHGKDMAYIQKTAIEVCIMTYKKSLNRSSYPNRFSGDQFCQEQGERDTILFRRFV